MTAKRQVVLSTYNHEMPNKASINPQEVLITRRSATIEAARTRSVREHLQSGAPVGDLIVSRTVPKNIHPLCLFDGKLLWPIWRVELVKT